VVNEKLEAKQRNNAVGWTVGRWGWERGGGSTEGNQTHGNHLQFDKEAAEGAVGGMDTRGCSCDHLLMRDSKGRGVDCLAAAEHRLA
jgi:hypothetical protein